MDYKSNFPCVCNDLYLGEEYLQFLKYNDDKKHSDETITSDGELKVSLLQLDDMKLKRGELLAKNMTALESACHKERSNDKGLLLSIFTVLTAPLSGAFIGTKIANKNPDHISSDTALAMGLVTGVVLAAIPLVVYTRPKTILESAVYRDYSNFVKIYNSTFNEIIKHESCKRNNNMQSFSFKIYNKEKLY